MSKLLLKHEGVILNTYSMTRGVTTIGRNSNNSIQLNDAIASGHHAKITLTQNEYLDEQDDATLEDLTSTNGTQVNGCMINTVQLRHGDEIKIGSQHFIYERDEAVAMDETAIYLPDND
ncbi:MAG: FHA domain-containing protein [Woeseiaceae bacterium]